MTNQFNMGPGELALMDQTTARFKELVTDWLVHRFNMVHAANDVPWYVVSEYECAIIEQLREEPELAALLCSYLIHQTARYINSELK